MSIVPLPKAWKLRTSVLLTCLKEDASDMWHRRRAHVAYPGSAEILADLRRNGCHVIRGYYDRERCVQIRRAIDETVERYPDRLNVDEEQSDHRIWGGENVSELIKAFFADPVLHALAEAYLEAPVRNITTLAAKLVATPRNEGSGKGCHRDSMYEKQFKAFLYLSDVEEENGPFQYFIGTNSKRSVLQTLELPHVGSNLKRFEGPAFDGWCDARRAFIKTITGRAGDAILADTRGIHTGIPIKSGARYALTNYYAPAHRYEQMRRIFEPYIKF